MSTFVTLRDLRTAVATARIRALPTCGDRNGRPEHPAIGPALTPAELVEPLVVDAKVMRHLVEHRLADLGRQVPGPSGKPEMLFTEDADAIRRRGEVVHPPVLEHHALIEAEEMITVFGLCRRRPILHNNVQVVDLVHYPLREFIEDAVNDPLEGFQVAAIGQFGI